MLSETNRKKSFFSLNTNGQNNYHLFLIICVLTIAFSLRIWGVWNVTSTDEYNEVFEALRVCSGNLNTDRWFKRFYLYVLSIEYGLFYVFGWVLNIFQSPYDFAVKIVRDIEPLFLLGRITSAFLGTGSVFMTYIIGKKLFNRTTGLLAAIFLSLNVVNIEISHYARVDSSLCFLTLVTFYGITQIFLKNYQTKTGWYILTGIFLGCAFQTKPQAVVLIAPFAYAHFNKYKFTDFQKGLFQRKILWFCIGGLLGLVIGNPAVLVAPIKFIESFLGLGRVYTTPINESRGELGFIAYARYFFQELGVVMILFSGFCVIKSSLCIRREDILLFSFMLPFYVLMGSSRYMVSYSYLVPFMPFLYIYLINAMNRYLSSRFSGHRLTTIIALVSLVLLIHPVAGVARFEKSISGANTRILSKNWIEENIPFGSKILMDSGKTINSSSPLIAMNKIAIERLLAEKEKEIEEGILNDSTKMVDAKSLVYFEMLLETVPKESYDITSTGFGLNVYSLDYYINEEFEYIIISESMKNSRINDFFTARSPKVASFYRSLDRDPRIERLKIIEPTNLNSGDTFHIYRIQD